MSDVRARPGKARQAGSAALAGLAGAATGIIIVLLVWLIVRTEAVRPSAVPSSPATQPATQPAQAAAPPAAAKPAVSPKPSTKPVQRAPLGDVRDQRPGLLCRDLKAKGFSYSAAIDYWRYNGQPNAMDADRNGIPCETVYARADVRSYWGGRALPSGQVPAGLFCRDLAARGLSYAEAVAYWWTMSQPARMDADSNGIPCETVYPAADVNRFWYG